MMVLRTGTIKQHGTSTGYTYGCRCDECRAARIAEKRDWSRRNPDKVRGYNAKNRTRHERGVSTATHGTRTRYLHGCRCEDCTRSNREYARAWKTRPVES